MPNDAELRRTGISFTRAFTATAMCSPSRATLPHRHVSLAPRSHAHDDRGRPVPRPGQRARRAAHGRAARASAARCRAAGWPIASCGARCGSGPRAATSPSCRPGTDTLASLLRERGYHVAFKGKWHLSKPVGGDGWSAADSERIERDYGFADWEPPDAGGDAKAATFGGGNAGTTHEGWDEDYTRQMERWLAQADLPEPFCLVFSLVNPHDVLGYPSSFVEGGYSEADFRGLGVPLPADGRRGPARQADRALADEARADRLHRRRSTTGRPSRTTWTSTPTCTSVVDEKIGRLLAALGDPGDPGSLRSRTVIARISDHGELGHVARRAAAEDVQRLRGVDPGAARDLEPAALPRAARERRAGVARRPGARRCSG